MENVARELRTTTEALPAPTARVDPGVGGVATASLASDVNQRAARERERTTRARLEATNARAAINAARDLAAPAREQARPALDLLLSPDHLGGDAREQVAATLARRALILVLAHRRLPLGRAGPDARGSRSLGQ
jgi:hypothetical protein